MVVRDIEHCEDMTFHRVDESVRIAETKNIEMVSRRKTK
jgi:hypothetical protein